MTQQIKIILFDLGGVIIELDGPPIKPSWIDYPLSTEENWRMWGESNAVKNFETGRLPAQEFASEVILELNLNVSHDDFVEAFVTWPKGFLPDARQLLKQLKERYTLAFYSNTNVFHLPRLMRQCQLKSYFDSCFASYEIGYFKPDIQGYQYITSQLEVTPKEILFLDDNQINVTGAISAGLHAKKTVGVNDVKLALKQFNIL